MSARFLLAATVAALVAAPARAADLPAAPGKPRPTVVLQAQPAGKLIADVQDMIRLAAGPEKGEAAVKQFQEELEDELGEKGFEGVDLNRPLAAYATVREKFEDSSLVLVVPVTTEKDFLGFLDRLEFKAAEVNGKKGLYKLVPPNKDIFPNDSFVRFADGWAYVGLNGDEVADPANLILAADLTDPAQDVQVVARLYPDRLPEKLLKAGLAEFENGVTGAKQFFLPQDNKAVAKGLGTVVDEGLKLLRRTAEGLQKDGREVALRYSFDPTAGTAMEVVVTPKPGTELAKAIAARQPTANRFAGLLGPDTAIGFVGQAPLFSPETRELAGAAFEMLNALAEAEDEIPGSLRPVLAAACKGLGRTAKAGTGDFALAVVGPDKGGLFTVVGAVSFDDPSGVEKTLRAAVEKDGLLKKLTKLDAAKVDGTTVHTIALGNFLKGVFAKELGENAVLCLGFGKDAIFAAVGPADAAVPAVKAAAGAKSGPAPAAQLLANPSRLVKLVETENGKQQAGQLAAALGAEDKLTPGWGVTITGGEKLTIRVVASTYFTRLSVLE